MATMTIAAYIMCHVHTLVRSCKSKRHNDWFRSSAKAMDMILDESLYPSSLTLFSTNPIKYSSYKAAKL